MAKKHNNRQRRSVTRDTKIIARQQSLRSPVNNIHFNPYTPRRYNLDRNLSLFDGRRSQFRPRRYQQQIRNYTLEGNRAFDVMRFMKGKSLVVKHNFTIPDAVAPCVRRSRRREVLFAAGKGGRNLKIRKVRRNASSSIRC